MSIRSQDIDPAIAVALKERMDQIIAGQSGLEPGAARLRGAGLGKWYATLKRNSYHFWAAGACCVGGVASIPMIADLGPGPTVTVLFGMQALGLALIGRAITKTNHDVTQFANPELMRSAGELIALSPVEALYCEGVAALIDAERTLPEGTQGEILKQLNDLLASFRNLDGPVRQSLAARGNQSLEGLEGELFELVRRRDAAVDPTARATLDQSVALCSQRLADARILAPAREQAEAQQELIRQAMASVQSSLARMAAANSGTVQADVGELERTVTQVNQQTRAVEDAVQEVITLRG